MVVMIRTAVRNALYIIHCVGVGVIMSEVGKWY